MDPLVRIERDDDLATVIIDRPERRNALGSAAAKAVADAINEASRTARVIILTGAGEAFCAGGDLEELERWSDLDKQEIGGILYESFQGMVRAIRASNAVVIAAVNGAAVGAGMDLALACDLRIASESARFGQVWVRLGVIPGTGGAWLTQMHAGPTKASELLLTGRLIDAHEALECRSRELGRAGRRAARRRTEDGRQHPSPPARGRHRQQAGDSARTGGGGRGGSSSRRRGAARQVHVG